MYAVAEPLLANLVMVSLLWLLSVLRRNASIIDLLWPLMFVVAAWIWFQPSTAQVHHWLVLALVMAWGARLHIYLARRNLGHGEDRRYQAIRRNNFPGFWWKSYFIVFLLQAVLAWIASFAIYGALQAEASLPWLLPGLALAAFGLVFEAAADWQLAAFNKLPANKKRVLDTGLWKLTRHPNYFGECCFWWGVFLCAMPAYWWAVVSPLLMTLLLLRVSGVSLLEKDIGERRPGYRDYVHSTPAFFPAFGKLLRSDD